jgi:hypothetical protein
MYIKYKHNSWCTNYLDFLRNNNTEILSLRYTNIFIYIPTASIHLHQIITELKYEQHTSAKLRQNTHWCIIVHIRGSNVFKYSWTSNSWLIRLMTFHGGEDKVVGNYSTIAIQCNIGYKLRSGVSVCFKALNNWPTQHKPVVIPSLRSMAKQNW